MGWLPRLHVHAAGQAGLGSGWRTTCEGALVLQAGTLLQDLALCVQWSHLPGFNHRQPSQNEKAHSLKRKLEPAVSV